MENRESIAIANEARSDATKGKKAARAASKTDPNENKSRPSDSNTSSDTVKLDLILHTLSDISSRVSSLEQKRPRESVSEVDDGSCTSVAKPKGRKSTQGVDFDSVLDDLTDGCDETFGTENDDEFDEFDNACVEQTNLETLCTRNWLRNLSMV